ncbi:MAG: hypothetical protein EP346_00035 [Bacteroidetes bacterium]|nr:MAG: hypothetical protein EP346_00035 [Bacteroidota bacterium]
MKGLFTALAISASVLTSAQVNSQSELTPQPYTKPDFTQGVGAGNHGWSGEWHDASMRVYEDTILNRNPQPNMTMLPRALNLAAKFNNVIGASNLIEFGDTLYTLFQASNTHWYVAKKPAIGGAWVEYDLSNVFNNPIGDLPGMDSHYRGAISIDKKGYIHVVANTYRTQIRYIRSTSPLNITKWTEASMVGTNEAELSYPTFINSVSDSTLMFLYRDGNSFDGDAYLNIYNSTTETWSRQCQLTNGAGYNFYWNTVQVDNNGRLHISGLWRTSPGAPTAEDITYFYSDDYGSTWFEYDGTSLTLPITKATVNPIFETPQDTGLINQTGMGVDSLGRVSIVTTLLDSTGNLNYYQLSLVDSSWSSRFISKYKSGDRPDFVYHYGFGRPSVFTIKDRSYALWTNRFDSAQGYAGLVLSEITPNVDVRSTILFSGDLGTSDFPLDEWGLSNSSTLRFLLMFQPILPNCQTSGSGGVFSIDSKYLDKVFNGSINIDAFSSSYDFKSSIYCEGIDTFYTWLSDDVLEQNGNTLLLADGFNDIQIKSNLQLYNLGGNFIRIRDIDGNSVTSRVYMTFEPSSGIPMAYFGYKSGANSTFSIQNDVGNVDLAPTGVATVNGAGIWDTDKITSSDTANWSETYNRVENELLHTESQILDFPSISAGDTQSLTVTFSGAVDGDLVVMGKPSSVMIDGMIYQVHVTAPNTIEVLAQNTSASSIDPPSAEFKFKILR